MRCDKCGAPIDTDRCESCAAERLKAAMAQAAYKVAAMRRLGSLKAYERFTAEKFDNAAALAACAEFPSVNLFIYGRAGSGKTHLATALARQHNGIVVKPQHIYRECRGLAVGPEEQEAINSYIDEPCLVVDDLGADKKTDWNLSTLYEIVDGRDMDCMTGLIVTSNLSLDELAERLGDDRITSRLNGMCKVIKLDGPDRRDTK